MEEENSWIKYIKGRITRNKNFLCIISGSTGSGKSWTALSIAEQLDSNFSVDRCVFKGSELLRLINSGKLFKGAVIVFDESQIDMSARNWQSAMNKLINYLITTFRHQNFILIFTSPYVDFIDSGTLKLFHANFETVSISMTKKTCTLKPKLLQYNQGMKKWYRKYLKFIRPGVGVIKIKRWIIPKPSAKLIELYEEKKIEFTKKLNKEIELKLNSLDDEGKPKKLPTGLQQQVIDCWRQGISKTADIARFLKVESNQISTRIYYLALKGYFKEQYLPENSEKK